MVLGIGIDSVEIARVAKLCGRAAFVDRILTDQEKHAWNARGSPPESVAGIFAAKEATSKAMGKSLSLRDFRQMELSSDGKRPTMVLMGDLLALAQRMGVERIFISISHDKTRAVAVALMEG